MIKELKGTRSREFMPAVERRFDGFTCSLGAWMPITRSTSGGSDMTRVPTHLKPKNWPWYMKPRKLISVDSTRQRLGMEYAFRKKNSERYMGFVLEGRRFIGVRGGLTREEAEALAEKYRRMEGYLARIKQDEGIPHRELYGVFVWREK